MSPPHPTSSIEHLHNTHGAQRSSLGRPFIPRAPNKFGVLYIHRVVALNLSLVRSMRHGSAVCLCYKMQSSGSRQPHSCNARHRDKQLASCRCSPSQTQPGTTRPVQCHRVRFKCKAHFARDPSIPSSSSSIVANGEFVNCNIFHKLKTK